jgi:hypothetical protein
MTIPIEARKIIVSGFFFSLDKLPPSLLMSRLLSSVGVMVWIFMQADCNQNETPHGVCSGKLIDDSV